jgi:hypothetical protein
MANLSNINNKFIVTDGNNGRVLIGATNDIGATLFANHPSTTAPSLTFNAPAGQVFENEDLQFAFGLNNASPYNGYMQTRFVSAPYYRNLAINPLGGNVGIGTNSPTYNLVVSSGGASGVEFAIATATGLNEMLSYNRSTSVFEKLRTQASQFEWYTDATANALVIQSGGNVGIGTASPNTALQVNQNTTVPLLVHRPSNTNFDPHGIGFSTRNDAADGGLGDVRSGIFSDYNGDLFLAAATSSITTSPLTYSRLFIEGGNGNVGIGTESPLVRLQLERTVSAATSRTAPVNLIYLTSEHPSVGYTGFGTAITHYSRTYQNGAKTEQSKIAFTQQGDSVSTAGSTIDFYTKTLSTGSAAPDFRMRINYNGNVGIGITDPEDRLQIDHPGNPTAIRIGDNTTDDCYVIFNTDGNDWSIGTDRSDSNKFKISDYSRVGTNDRLVIDTSGNVAIGTTSPAGKLQVVNNSQSTAALTVCNEANGGDGFVFQKWQYVESTSNFRLDLKQRVTSGIVQYAFDMVNNGTGYTSVLVLDRGSVGIGTTSPNAKLDVNGALKAQRFFSRNGSFSSTSGNWHNVVDLQQSEYENRTLICSVYTNGTHSYSSATVNVAYNGGNFVLTLGNKISGGSTDIRISGAYLQFYTPWTSTGNFWRITIN